METRILLLRHGQSVANIEKFFAGRTDIPLTALGEEQARMAAESLKDLHLDRIFSSPLERAKLTALPFATARGLEIEIIPELIEWGAGKWEGMHFDDLKEAFPEEYYYWKNDVSHLRMPSGESGYEVRERVGRALEGLCEKCKGQTVLVACHGGVIKTVPSYFAGCDDKLFNQTKVPGNCSITEVVFENGVGSVARYSDDSHLGNIKSEAFII